MVQGLVIRSTGAFYKVLVDGKMIDCTLRGKLRLEDSEATNPVAVGDQVILELEDDKMFIDKVLDRENYIVRRSMHNERQVQILASNVSQAVLIATLHQPFTSLGLIDRFLVSAEFYHIPVIILFNKSDLCQKGKFKAQLENYVDIYDFVGYEVYPVSVKDLNTKDLLQDILKDQTTFVAGVSGAGKSSLINLVEPHLKLRTQELVKQTQKGRHTTTFAEMHPLSFGGWVIDAPGVKEFYLTDIEPYELGGYFPEMRALLPACKFYNCTHLHEPGCAVIDAYEKGEIPHSRYHTYQGMVEELNNKKKW